MAETRSVQQECALPAKRKPDLTSSNADEDPPSKTPKAADKINGDSNSDGGAKTTVQAEDNGAAKTEVTDAAGRSGDDLRKDEEEEEEVQHCESYEDDEEDDEDYDEDDDVEEGTGRVADVKGKGILKDDKGKGKGKLIVDDDDDEEEDSDIDEPDDTDSSDSGGDVRSGSDNDWSDDPLAEVDLDNILPSRTRRRRAQTGIVFADNRRNTDGSGGDADA